MELITEKITVDTIERLAVAYPSGNATAVIFDSLNATDNKQLNDKIIQAWGEQQPEQPEIEQCCFVAPPRNPEAIARVEMLGGEFCGNATRSVLRLITDTNTQGIIEVSGAKEALEFSVQDNEIAVQMPLGQEKLVDQVAEGTLVSLEGITHLVVDANADTSPHQLLLRLIRANKYGLANQPAVGVSRYDPTSQQATFCVWIKTVDTVFDETACGSGTCAIGIALADSTQQSVKLSVLQPSGERITTEATYTNSAVIKSWIAGSVDILYDGAFTL